MDWIYFLIYFFRSGNRHGLHSPFVYALYEGFLKEKDIFGLISCFFSFFQIESYHFFGDFFILKPSIFPVFEKIKNNKKALIIGESFDETLLQEQKKDFDALVFLFPFKNKKKIEKFVLDPFFQVSVDLFLLLFVFKREQAKEHFFLKISSKIIFFTLKKSIFWQKMLFFLLKNIIFLFFFILKNLLFLSFFVKCIFFNVIFFQKNLDN